MDLRFPIGTFVEPASYSAADRDLWIGQIASAPTALRAAVAGLDDRQLDTPYRPEGWTVRQVVHHLADSHINSIMRFKLALTEETPTIRPYDERLWAELDDARTAPIDLSLSLVDALHARWTTMLRAMTPEDFQRTFHHPEHDRTFTLDRTVAMYAWHGRHHIAHITSLRERMGW
jgi:hypothetical protein